MPKFSTGRSVRHERAIAERVRVERESRGWTYEGLAERMSAAGYPVAASGLFKLEKADPPRRITADEWIGFADVFGLDLAAMAEPASEETAARIRAERCTAARHTPVVDITEMWERTRHMLCECGEYVYSAADARLAGV